jgi:hypothetical protein
MSTPVRSNEIPLDHTATSISRVPVGRWLILRARRNEIQSPFVFPFCSGFDEAEDGSLGAFGAKKTEGRAYLSVSFDINEVQTYHEYTGCTIDSKYIAYDMIYSASIRRAELLTALLDFHGGQRPRDLTFHCAESSHFGLKRGDL